MLVIGSNKIDLWLSAFFSVFTKLWCRVTGKTNVALAYLLLGCGAGLVFPWVFTVVRSAPWVLLGLVFWGYGFLGAWAKLRHIERHISERDALPPEVVPIPPQCILDVCRWRQWWIVVALFSAATPPYDLVSFGYALGVILAGMSLYVILHVDMGWQKESLWARAKGWLRRHAPSLGPVVPAPAPA